MRTGEFKAWLDARRWKGVLLTDTGKQSRLRRIKRVDRSLGALGFAGDLDAVAARGEIPALVTKLNGFIGGGDRPPRSLVPQAVDPDGQLRNLVAVTKLYGRFTAGEDPSAHDEDGEDENQTEPSDADDIRALALSRYIEPARANGDVEVSIRAGDVLEALGYDQGIANVCQALSGRKFQQMAQTPKPRSEGPGQSHNTTFTYQLDGAASAEAAPPPSTPPTNLILFGPPGTGKTYRTAAEAVRLCDGVAPSDRATLMARYGVLEREGRIGFVTFHQSYSYEDFVEGLRPETGEEKAAVGGFRLDVRKGAFCEIAALADQARLSLAAPAPMPAAGAINLEGRRFWKMSLGATRVEDHVYDEAIDGNRIVLGWGGEIDWSDPVYADLKAIRAKWAEVEKPGDAPSNYSQLWRFRSELKIGDIVIIPHGNRAFRAIGEVAGDYEFKPGGEGYNHARAVRWLLVLDTPLPLDTIVDGDFTMRTIYPIDRRRIRTEALARLVHGEPPSDGPRAPQAFVLIVDEINRANISKVFGELITLIEPDKRLGMDNAIRVKLPYSGDPFGVPANLHIIGTMNTADRSIALLDTALRRRFSFQELMPEPKLLADAARRTQVDLVAVLTTLNARIEYLFDREHQIGHAFFMGCEDREDVDAVMRDRVIPLLQEYFFEDWSRLAMVLGERQGVRDGAFLRSERLAPPPGFEGEDRWRWSVREIFAPDAYERLIGKLSVANEEALATVASSAAE